MLEAAFNLTDRRVDNAHKKRFAEEIREGCRKKREECDAQGKARHTLFRQGWKRRQGDFARAGYRDRTFRSAQKGRESSAKIQLTQRETAKGSHRTRAGKRI